MTRAKFSVDFAVEVFPSDVVCETNHLGIFDAVEAPSPRQNSQFDLARNGLVVY